MIFVGIGIGIVITIIVISIIINVEHNKIFNQKPKEITFPNGVKIELKPCPYCGGNYEILVESRNPDSTPLYAIRCNSLEGGCGSETGFYSKSIDAILAWNMRGGSDDE